MNNQQKKKYPQPIFSFGLVFSTSFFLSRPFGRASEVQLRLPCRLARHEPFLPHSPAAKYHLTMPAAKALRLKIWNCSHKIPARSSKYSFCQTASWMLIPAFGEHQGTYYFLQPTLSLLSHVRGALTGTGRIPTLDRTQMVETRRPSPTIYPQNTPPLPFLHPQHLPLVLPAHHTVWPSRLTNMTSDGGFLHTSQKKGMCLSSTRLHQTSGYGDGVLQVTS